MVLTSTDHKAPPILTKPRHSKPGQKKILHGFTLIELLITIAILGILASAILIAINPSKRSRQARDAIRKSHVNIIANALEAYYVLNLTYPINKVTCEASNGSYGSWCPNPNRPTYSYWDDGTTTTYGFLHDALVNVDKTFKLLPVDPINDSNYYIWYFSWNSQPPIINDWQRCGYPFPNPPPCPVYWVGTFLEDPSDSDKPIFRCSNIDDGSQRTPGCTEVWQWSAPSQWNKPW